MDDVSSDPRMGDPTPFSSFTAHSEVNQFALPTNGTFGPPHFIPVPLLPDITMTSDVQGQAHFLHKGLQDLNAAAAQPERAPMEASSMAGVQDQTDPQNHQSCKYDLLSSIPRESDLHVIDRGLKCPRRHKSV